MLYISFRKCYYLHRCGTPLQIHIKANLEIPHGQIVFSFIFYISLLKLHRVLALWTFPLHKGRNKIWFDCLNLGEGRQQLGYLWEIRGRQVGGSTGAVKLQWHGCWLRNHGTLKHTFMLTKVAKRHQKPYFGEAVARHLKFMSLIKV